MLRHSPLTSLKKDKNNRESKTVQTYKLKSQEIR